MNAVRQDESQTAQRQAAKSEKLPYCIELWAENNARVEKVLARAATASLARAIFSAACDEHRQCQCAQPKAPIPEASNSSQLHPTRSFRQLSTSTVTTQLD